jgi:hypothetical protein
VIRILAQLTNWARADAFGDMGGMAASVNKAMGGVDIDDHSQSAQSTPAATVWTTRRGSRLTVEVNWASTYYVYGRGGHWPEVSFESFDPWVILNNKSR